MARSFFCLFVLILFICTLPSRHWAAELELRQAGTGTTDISVLVGDEIEVELWIHSASEQLSGAAIFLSFDESVFALADQDRQSVAAGFQPFASGQFLRNGEVFRNTLLDPDDPAANASGAQLDYSVVRAIDQGSGLVASFRLRALAPIRSSSIRIDESGIRETRVFLPDGSQRAFRFITPMRIAVRGITIEGLPSTLVLARGQADTTLLRLNDFIFDPIHSFADIQWDFPSTTTLSLHYDQGTHQLQIAADADAAPWERLILTATNPDGQTMADTVDVFVNARPVLAEFTEPISITEDGSYELALEIEDPDTPVDLLQVQTRTSEEMAVTIAGPPYSALLTPAPDWNGSAQVTFIAIDNFDFADTTRVNITVNPVNDPPEVLLTPNIRLTRGKQDSSLALADLVRDPEEAADELRLSWSGADKVQIDKQNGRLVLQARDHTWLGTEEITLQLEDAGGLGASTLLTVTIVPSLPPNLQDPPQRYGLTAGGYFILGLNDLVVDPDDLDQDLEWQVDGQEKLLVQLNGTGEVRIEAPASFTGTETVEFTVFDPSGESASFGLVVFSAPPSGEPVLSPLPEITVPLDGVDTSLDLDDYVFDVDDAATAMEWIMPARDDLNLDVDPDTHVLTIQPTATAWAQVVDLELEVRDPDGHRATQSVRIHITGGSQEPAFAFDPIQDLNFRVGQTHEFDLDDFVSGSVPVEEVEWQVEGLENLEVEIDATTHQVRISARGDWQGSESITFVAMAGEDILRRSVQVTILDSTDSSAPQLSPLPTLTIKAGDFDQSLDLDDFVTGIDPTGLTWEVSGDAHTQIVVDAETHRLIILAGADWSGEELLVFTARDGQNQVLEGTLRLQILPLETALSLRSITQAPLFAGENQIRLEVADLLQGEVDPTELTWEASAAQTVNVLYDPVENVLILQPSSPWQGSEIITLRARDPEGNEASGQVLAQVYPTDGSVGKAAADFRVVIVPNVMQPEFLDVFVISDTPLLQVEDETWHQLSLANAAPGIWYGDHTLNPGQEGQFYFMALALDAEEQVIKAATELSVGTFNPPSAKRLSGDQVLVYLPAHSFADDAVVAILPASMPDPGAELIPLSPAYIIHSPQRYQPRAESRISMPLPAAQNANRAALYRWNASDDRWVFAGADKVEGRMRAPLEQLGIYALMEDRTPPQLQAALEKEDQWRFSWTDQGSGIGTLAVMLNRDPLPPSAYSWDGEWLEIYPQGLPEGQHQLSIQVTDRAGNPAIALEKTAVGAATPEKFLLGQNFPNPFNPSTAIPFFLPTSAQVRLGIYNAAGQRIRSLLDEPLSPGAHELIWNARDDRGQAVSSGLYLYRLEVDGRAKIRKMTLMR
jgi:hypothetical protein